MRIRLPSLLLLSFASLLTGVVAQNPLPPPNGDYDYHLPGLNGPDWMNSRANHPRPPAESRVLTKGVLAPAEVDRLKYAGFLSQSNTGLVRLLPRQFSNSKFSRPNAVKINGGGAYYSFAYLSHEYGYGSDIELTTVFRFYGSNEQPPDHLFQVGFAGADFGLLTNIGDVTLESVSRNDAKVAFLFNYKPPRAEQRARCEHRMLGVGVQYEGQKYSNRAAIETNSTYVLRSVNYDKSDVLVAFRVVRRDQDDSVTIAWKLLKKFSVPTLDQHKVDPNFKCPIR